MVREDSLNKPSTAMDNGGLEDFEKDLDALLREHQKQRGNRTVRDRSMDLNIHRSGSAPPTVQGSLSAIDSVMGNASLLQSNSFLTDEEIRFHPDYLANYYSSENLNPRLPPPLLSRGDWRAAQRFRVGASSIGGIDERWKKEMVMVHSNGSRRSLFSLQPGDYVHGHESELMEVRTGMPQNLTPQTSAEWLGRGSDGLTEMNNVGWGERRRSFTDGIQEELSRPIGLSHQDSHSASRDVFGNGIEPIDVSNTQLAHLQSVEKIDRLRCSTTSPGLARAQSFSSTLPGSLPSRLSPSLVRSTTPGPQLSRRSLSPSPSLVSVRNDFSSDEVSSSAVKHDNVLSSLYGLNISRTRLVSGENYNEGPFCHSIADQSELLFDDTNNYDQYAQHRINKPESKLMNIPSIPAIPYNNLSRQDGFLYEQKISANRQSHLPKHSSSIGPHTKVPSLRSSTLEGSAVLGGSEGRYLGGSRSRSGHSFQAPLIDPFLGQNLQGADAVTQSNLTLSNHSVGRNYVDALPMDVPGDQQAYLKALLVQQKLQLGMPLLGKSVGLDHGYYGNAAYGPGSAYENQPSAFMLPSPGSGYPLRQSEHSPYFPSVMKSSAAGSLGSWTSEINEVGCTSSFLEDFKNNMTKKIELSEILDHVVELSVDQYGSRFIQQKLETASVEVKNKIFPEILPHARALMIDVFGNYVIQKFFEHGTESQRAQLADRLAGHILPLSLQMYGCRVIQKALEVLDVERQTQMILELDGSIMKCVRDQNANHVIQKCIECVPQERIQFVISSFYGQVVALSTHPYGCRVIQRVLEHSDDMKTLSIMMEEILQSVSVLAHDQYGNYVVQHVLQHGKPEERTAMFNTFAGQIVKMSLQKFSSNVVEKCLTFGSVEDRQQIIDEMLGSTDENAPLQAMMKDPYGNYVVQKVLEICDDNNRELILSRVKIHLDALKKFTYGKHIVARVEKLMTAGEKHVGISSRTW